MTAGQTGRLSTEGEALIDFSLGRALFVSIAGDILFCLAVFGLWHVARKHGVSIELKGKFLFMFVFAVVLFPTVPILYALFPPTIEPSTAAQTHELKISEALDFAFILPCLFVLQLYCIYRAVNEENLNDRLRIIWRIFIPGGIIILLTAEIMKYLF